MPSPAASGDNIGRQLVFDLDDPVAQVELALLQPLYLQEIGAGGIVQRLDGGIEITMLLAQPRQLRPEFAIVLLLHRCRYTEGLIGHLGGSWGCRPGA